LSGYAGKHSGDYRTGRSKAELLGATYLGSDSQSGSTERESLVHYLSSSLFLFVFMTAQQQLEQQLRPRNRARQRDEEKTKY
jgi:hypothetical protein